jgi:peptidyl-prolyl cis-trans isomerase A (cyclophilin A)
MLTFAPSVSLCAFARKAVHAKARRKTKGAKDCAEFEMHFKNVNSMRAPFSFIILLLFSTNLLPSHSGSAATQTRNTRAALMNPQHKFWNKRAPDIFQVRFETSKGDFIIEAHRDWSPHGVDRFYNLVRARFFDDSRFFRVRAGFIAQFGIPGNPLIAAVWKNQTIPDDAVRQSNTRGFVSYAMTGPNARTTQLFINLADNSRLDKEGFAPIGKIIEGMQVVDQLYAGYGEDAGGGMRGGKQGKIFEGGNVYLDREFPKLDKLMRARVVKKT